MPQHKRKDLTGKQIGLWLVLAFSHTRKRKSRHFAVWRCRCRCGVERDVMAMTLNRRLTASCGCQAGTHRLYNSSEYKIWAQMIDRCTRPANGRYLDYGGRGIIVCDRWRKFINFYTDVGPRPSMRYTLDREDNDGNYEPGNVCWATAAEQMQNQRRTKLTPEKVLAIRALATANNRHSLATAYGVTPAMIDRVSKGRSWKNIGGAIRP